MNKIDRDVKSNAERAIKIAQNAQAFGPVFVNVIYEKLHIYGIFKGDYKADIERMTEKLLEAEEA